MQTLSPAPLTDKHEIVRSYDPGRNGKSRFANDTQRKSSRLTKLGPRLVNEDEPAVEWADYIRIEPGEYQAYCKYAHWYWEPGFKRWTCLLRFDVSRESDLQSSLGIIPMWMNGGNGKKPQTGRRSLYFPAWVKANGGPPPRQDRLSPRVFVKRIAMVKVADTLNGALPYSVVRQIIEWSTGTPVNQSHSQEGFQEGHWNKGLGKVPCQSRRDEPNSNLKIRP